MDETNIGAINSRFLNQVRLEDWKAKKKRGDRIYFRIHFDKMSDHLDVLGEPFKLMAQLCYLVYTNGGVYNATRTELTKLLEYKSRQLFNYHFDRLLNANLITYEGNVLTIPKGMFQG